MNITLDKTKLTGLNDIVFKAIMYPKIHLMKSILESVLNRNIDKLRYLGQEIPVVQFIEKGKRLDAFAETENEYFDIEVSTKFSKYISWRNYAFASQVYTKTVKRGEHYKDYKHTYLINIIGNRKGKIPIRIGKNVDQINDDMTNVITEIQINVDYFIKEYYNKGNKKLINKYKYIIMLGLALEELKEFNKEYGDDVVEEYTETMDKILDDEEIEPLFTFREEKIIEAREEGIEIGEKIGEKRGEKYNVPIGVDTL